MATTKTAKVQAEIEKAKVKLAEQQARIKELEVKHTEYENMEIVDIVRGLKIPLDDLAAALQSIRGGAAPVLSTTTGQVGTKSKREVVIPETTTTDKEDETE
jgi:hypothetical protein